jgi:hypothetical protein
MLWIVSQTINPITGVNHQVHTDSLIETITRHNPRARPRASPNIHKRKERRDILIGRGTGDSEEHEAVSR